MNDIPVYDEREGSGPALVFLHYWGGSARTWRLVADRFPDRQVVRLDFRGWARSAGLPGPYGIGQYADDVVAVLHDAGVEDHVLVGHSMGGKVAQLVAARRSRGLRGLVLVAPGPARRAAEVTPEYQEQLAHAYDDDRSIITARDDVLTANPLSDALKQQVLADSGSARSVEARSEWPLYGISTDITDQTGRIAVPALVVAGEHDVVEPEETLRSDLLPYLSDARLVVVPKSGHLIPLEAPQELAQLIESFVRAT